MHRRRAIVGRSALLTAALVLALLGGCGLPGRSIEITGESTVIKADDGFDLWACRLVAKGLSQAKARAICLYLQGSEDRPVMDHAEALAGLCEMNVPVYAVERRGVHPDGTIDPAIARQNAARETRIKDSVRVLSWARERHDSKTPVILIGASEGGDVAAAVAARSKNITCVILLGSGGGWTQEEEFRHFIRARGEHLGLKTERELDEQITRIKAAPLSDEEWAGHPYRRWSSFLFARAADELLKVDCPILLVQGTADESVPIESARALREAFNKAGKANLRVVEIEGADHSFMNPQTKLNQRPLVELAVTSWLGEQHLLAPAEVAMYDARVRHSHPELFEHGGIRPKPKGK